ncbi:MAG: rod shape-determining protein MreD [Chlamydiae bacterium]|nr:rod shape-determining protein MreD [Chlamydiota bacterium]
MKKQSLLIPFTLSLLSLLIQITFFPKLKLMIFSPFLAYVYMKRSFLSSLWISAFCGLCMDCISSTTHFGIHALNYCITSIAVFRKKKFFFEDKSSALAFFVIFISFISILIQLVLLSLFGYKIPQDLALATDLIFIPIFNGIYAFLWFTCPINLYQYMQKKKVYR